MADHHHPKKKTQMVIFQSLINKKTVFGTELLFDSYSLAIPPNINKGIVVYDLTLDKRGKIILWKLSPSAWNIFFVSGFWLLLGSYLI